MSCAVGLIALGVGYLVYLQAVKEKEGLKLLGQVIGIFVMIAAVLSMFCMAKQMKDRCDGGGKNCPMMASKAPMCPLGESKEQ